MSLGPVLTTVLLLGSAPPAGVRPHEQDSGSELIIPPVEQSQAVRGCPHPPDRLTLEAFSRMAAGGAFSVSDITGSVTLSSEVQALRRLIVYHGMHPRAPSRAHVLLQVELPPSRTGQLQQVTKATLRDRDTRLDLQVWQEPACAGEGPRLLLAGVTDLRKLQTHPHALELKGGDGGSVEIATLENIILR